MHDKFWYIIGFGTECTLIDLELKEEIEIYRDRAREGVRIREREWVCEMREVYFNM